MRERNGRGEKASFPNMMAAAVVEVKGKKPPGFQALLPEKFLSGGTGWTETCVGLGGREETQTRRKPFRRLPSLKREKQNTTQPPCSQCGVAPGVPASFVFKAK